MPLTVGSLLGPYEIVALQGAGGMGEVYRARDSRLDRIVAIKVLTAQAAHDTDRLRRIEHEARAIASLNHPHICQLYDIGPGYLVLEYIDGTPLRGPVAAPEALRLAIQIARALEAAHDRGILHRDLKPTNILISRDGTVKLVDFGLAKLVGTPAAAGEAATQTLPGTLPGMVVGTPAYMSPEQAEGRPLDVRSDVFSFGTVLYELLSGTRAFEGSTTAALVSALLRDDPPPLQTSAAIERIVRRCLAKEPEDRFQTVAELRAVLEHSATELSSAPVSQECSIAVLPFANLSADKENEYFGDGLAEEIINALANIPGIRVVGRTSSFSFRGKDLDTAELGRRLRVEYLLEGSVRRAGNRLRVTAQLVTVRDGFHLWSERYDRELTDIFAIQDEVTRAITDVLRIKLTPQRRGGQRREPDLRAYEAYVTARAHWFKGTSESQVHFKAFLDRAIALDPEFAPPHGLLSAYYLMVAHLSIRPAREVMPLGRAAAAAALRLDPSMAEAHSALGVWAGPCSRDWREAERCWRLAMAREPVLRDVYLWHGNHYLLPLGRAAEAVEFMARGLEVDPLNLMYRHHWARGLWHAGRLQEAEDELRKVLETDANFPPALATLGALYAQQGRIDEALDLTERVHALTPWANIIAGQLAALLRRTGETRRAEALRDSLSRTSAYGAPTGMAIFHAMCGEFDRAAEWTARSLEEQHPEFIKIIRPWLQSTPPWPALARMMNLPA